MARPLIHSVLLLQESPFSAPFFYTLLMMVCFAFTSLQTGLDATFLAKRTEMSQEASSSHFGRGVKDTEYW